MIEEIKRLPFHDSSPLNINIDFSNRKIELVFEQEMDKPRITVIFYSVKNIVIDGFRAFNDFVGLEIYSADFSEQKDICDAKFLFIVRDGPDWELGFSFQKATIIRSI